MKIIRRDRLEGEEKEIDLDQLWYDIEYSLRVNKSGAVEKLDRKIELLYRMFWQHCEGKSQAEILVNAGNDEAYGYTYKIEETDDTTKQN
jgi:hypothetical protein